MAFPAALTSNHEHISVSLFLFSLILNPYFLQKLCDPQDYLTKT